MVSLSNLKKVDSYVAGLSVEEIKQRYGLKRVIKLASNENPFGVSPLVQETIKKYASFVFRYPRVGSVDLVEEISRCFKVDTKRIVVGNGSDELIDLIIRATARPEGNIVVFDPGFSIYELQAKLCKQKVKKVPLKEDFSFSLKDLYNFIDNNTTVVFLTNPYNPTGYAVHKKTLFNFLNIVPSHIFVVIDEAYIDFVDDIDEFSPISESHKYENLIILRTFSKAYGLAGLRLGFGVMSLDFAKVLRKIKLPFSVNILAEKAGIGALKDKEFYSFCVDVIKREREKMYNVLIEYGCKVLPSFANFLMFKPPISAETVYQKLLKRGIIIRSLKSYNIYDYLRVSLGTPEENKLFLKNLKQTISGTEG